MTRVWEHSSAKGSSLLVMLALADSANEEGYCWPSLVTIANKARMERRQVIRVIQGLEQAGEIRVQHRTKDGHKTSNMYWITLKGSDILTPPLGGSDMDDTRGSDILSLGSVVGDTRVVVPESLKPSINHNNKKRNIEPSKVRDSVLFKNNLFMKSWTDWLVYRKQIKKPLTEVTIDRQLKKLEAFSPEVAAKMIEQSLEHGWQGIFELKDGKLSGKDGYKEGKTEADRQRYQESLDEYGYQDH